MKPLIKNYGWLKLFMINDNITSCEVKLFIKAKDPVSGIVLSSPFDKEGDYILENKNKEIIIINSKDVETIWIFKLCQ